MINKKGLSDIIATVLIILLALAAVVIVWQFVRPMIESTAGQTSLQAKCFQVEAVPTGCNATTDTMVVQLKKGNSADIKEIIAIVESDSGARNTGETDVTTLFAGTLVPITNGVVTGDTAKAAVVVTDGTKEFACEPSTVTVTCGA